MVLALVFLCLIWLKGISAAGGHWGYEGETGTSRWAGIYLTCGGSQQSPINIESGNVKKEHWKPFNFKYYDATPTRMRIKNNGHSALVEMDAPNAPRVLDGGLNGEYIFTQFHFHWGKDSSQGSEHTIDGVRYPMELHLVHYKAQYGSLSEAIKYPDGLTVLGILFEVGPTDNAAFDPIYRSLQNIKTAGAVADVSARYPLSAYLPADRENFFRYLGSLTTPTCNEVVVWTVFRKPVSISEKQMEAFRQLLDEGGHSLVNNFRPAQQIRNRRVSVNAAGCKDCHDKEDGHFSYAKHASDWSKKFKTCAGKRQSPIDITQVDIVDFSFNSPLKFKYYDMPPSSISVKNNGHTAHVSLKQADAPSVSGGGLLGDYVFSQFHFHWGSNKSQGSEHNIHGNKYPLEVHLVHYRAAYGSLHRAVREPDGLAVFGILFQIREKDNKDLKSVIDVLKYIEHPGNEMSISSMDTLSSFIPRDTTKFYRYEGSLTTPTCNEAVIWTIFEDPLYISETQMKAFRELKGSGDHPISDNFRPVQPLNGRKILRNTVDSGSPIMKSTDVVILLLSILFINCWL